MTDNEIATSGKKPAIFIGSQGLRAGWGVALFAILCVALVVALNIGLHAVHFHAPKSDPNILDPISTLFQEGILAGVLVIATFVMLVIERRKASAVGFGLKNALPRFLQGVFFGLLALSALIGLLWLCKAITFERNPLGNPAMTMYGLQWAGAFVLVGIAEELAFRGYLQQTLARGLNFRWATLILGVLFAAAHSGNPGETPISLAMGFGFALLLSLSVWKTGAVWWAVGFHAAWDWAQSFLYGVADSGHPSVGTFFVAHTSGPAWLGGGVTGPEGSLLAFPVMLAVVVVIWFTIKKPDQALGVKF